MTRHVSFQTAAARRRESPIVWTIDGLDVSLRASVDMAWIAVLIDTLQETPVEGDNVMTSAIKRRSAIIDAIRLFVLDGSHENFDTVAVDLDFAVLNQMASELIREYSGTGNPTKPESSSDGSDATGESSMAGAQPEESTPSVSPSIEP